MWWLKLLVGALVVGFCVLLGYLAAGRYRARQKFYAQMCAFNERYLSELAYSRKPLSDFLAAFPATGDFEKTLARAAEHRSCGEELGFLRREERDDVRAYFDVLGRGDSRSQSEYFSARKTSLSGKKAESEKEAKARGALYLKLGLLAGLAVVILIV